MSQIPVKFRVVQIIFQNEGITKQAIFEILKKEYPLDRCIHEKGVQDYLQSLKAVGLIKVTGASSDKCGNLKLCYRITDYGESRMKYIG